MGRTHYRTTLGNNSADLNIYFIFFEKNNKTIAPSALMPGRLSYFSSGVDALCLTNSIVG